MLLNDGENVGLWSKSEDDNVRENDDGDDDDNNNKHCSIEQ